MAGVLCLALLPAQASAQEERWDALIDAGVTAYERTDYAEAERQFKAALEVAERFGARDARLATSLDALGQIYFLQGRYTEVEPLFQRAITVRGHLDVFNDGLCSGLSHRLPQGGVKDGELAVGLEAAEGLLRLQEAGGGPTQRHLGVAPALDVPLHRPDGADRVLDGVGAS